MGVFLKKIPCPGQTHVDSTPSCGVYDNGSAYCFACGKYFPKVQEPEISVSKPKVDLVEQYQYIDSLPLISHRGLMFPHDSRGYYICWPKKDYFKLRLWAPSVTEAKYYGAKGHKKPWFVYRAAVNRQCVLIEGEINALSLGLISELNECDIISPGSASNFYDAEMKLNLDKLVDYDTIYVIVDDDSAGVQAVIKCLPLLKTACIDIRIIVQKADCNQILVNYGQEKLKREMLELFSWV